MVTLEADLSPDMRKEPYASPSQSRLWGVFALGGAAALVSLVWLVNGRQPVTDAYTLLAIVIALFFTLAWSGDNLKHNDIVWSGFTSALFVMLAFTLGTSLSLALGVFGLLLAALLAHRSSRQTLYTACLLWAAHLPSLLLINVALQSGDSLTVFVGLIAAVVLRGRAARKQRL